MRSVAVFVLSALLLAPQGAVAASQETLATERALVQLGIPTGRVDGVPDEETARATCVWRELSGRTVRRSLPTASERTVIKSLAALTVPKYMRIGMNINLQCQTAVWVDSEWVETEFAAIDPVTGTPITAITFKAHRFIKRVMPVSTGMAAYPTMPGGHTIGWAVNRWWQSTIYPDGKMYRPFFFHDGMALHGSSSDTLVKWYPASHGCVRMLHADIDALWEDGFGVGDSVYLYGGWRG